MAADRLNVALCQLNPTLGDLSGNLALFRETYARALREQVDLAIFPELFVVGYPPQDLIRLPAFLEAVERTTATIVAETAGKGAAIILGTVLREADSLYNAALFIEDGRVSHIVRKHHLPNLGVFDEKRVFAEGELSEPFLWRGRSWGLMICEDMWHDDAFGRLSRRQADVAIIINGSPFEEDKQAQREAIVSKAAASGDYAIIYVNLYGGQDELVFDGQSFAASAGGEIVHRSPAFESDFAVLTMGRKSVSPTGSPAPIPERLAGKYAGAVLALRDYVRKNGHSNVLLGLSGGIDSALVAAIAADALGPDAVRGIMLPYEYTSQASLEDAATIAATLGIAYETQGIAPAVAGIRSMLGDTVLSPVAAENLQSRLRGLALMAWSNTSGELLLSTGNKSELAMGYATLYGDMNGAFNPLKDIYKTDVFALARWRNAHRPAGGLGPSGEVIPERTITRPPSAELRPDQTDQDSLPPYELLDAMLKRLIEKRDSVDDLVTAGFDRAIVEKVSRSLYANEFKRFQSCPGPKLTRMNLGLDRRYPMTNRWSG